MLTPVPSVIVLPTRVALARATARRTPAVPPLPDWAAAAVTTYEESSGGRLRAPERAEVARAVATRQVEPPGAPPRPPRHPIGVFADPQQDHRTRANRDACALAVRDYFHNRLAGPQMVQRHLETATGLSMAAKLVSHVEVGAALSAIEHDRADLWQILYRLYFLNWSVETTALASKHSPNTIRRWRDEALNRMVQFIYVDPIGWKERQRA